VTAPDRDIDGSDHVKVVEFYRCADSDCNNGNQDNFIGSTTKPMRSYTYQGGRNIRFYVDWTAPNQVSRYAAVGCIYNTETKEVVSDAPVKEFEVSESTGSSDGTGSDGAGSDGRYSGGDDDGTTTSPQVVQFRPPTAEFQDGEVVGKVYLENTGSGDMTSSRIVEMQVQPPEQGPLSLVDQRSRTCDSSRPENVHKNFQIDRDD